MSAASSTLTRPPSLLTRRTVPLTAAFFGFLFTCLAHGVFAVFLVLATIAMAKENAEEARPEEIPPPQVNFIDARLVKLGRQFDARELPNRRVPQQSTAPTENTRGFSKVRNLPPDASVRPPDSVEDVLTRLGTSAETQARLQQIYDQEGDEQGVQEGTATREEGDIYAGTLYGIFRRGWTVPPTIPEEELRTLSSNVTVTISAEGSVTSFDITNPSGNADFDLSVRQRLDNLVGSQLPEPPEEERARYWGQTVGFRPHGRHAR